MLYLQTCIIGFVILLIPLTNRQYGYGRDWFYAIKSVRTQVAGAKSGGEPGRR